MKYRWHATLKDVIEASKFSQIFELSPNQLQIRKKKKNVNGMFSLLGLDMEGVRNLTKANFNKFMEAKKKLEELVLKDTPIIVTTCNNSYSQRLKNLCFSQVIIDEAAQCTELETLLAIRNAKQVVLIGDHKQLGPIYKCQLDGPQSLFSRLVQNNYSQCVMLQHQYRMHQMLLQIPNKLFYNNLIQNSYQFNIHNKFIHKDRPLLFINSNSQESGFGVSKMNRTEAQILKEVLSYLINVKKINKGKLGIVSPYAGQIQLLKNNLTELGLEKAVMSIESWQGREKEYIVFSCVRSESLGFLKEYKRINVALTRAMHGLIIIGNEKILKTDIIWNKIIKIFKKENVFINNYKDTFKYFEGQEIDSIKNNATTK